MIAAEKWWGILEAYNLAIFPMQIVMITLGAILTVTLFVRPGSKANIMMKAYLAVSFAWIGVVFFLILGGGLPARYLQACLFITIAVLFAVDLFRGKIEFKRPEIGWKTFLAACLLLFTFLYPVVGMLVGHHYPKMIVAGTFPCPTTAFALVLLVLAIPKVDRMVYILLLIWAVPFPIFIQIPKFGVYEDSIMLGIGIYSLIMLIKNWTLIGKERVSFP